MQDHDESDLDNLAFLYEELRKNAKDFLDLFESGVYTPLVAGLAILLMLSIFFSGTLDTILNALLLLPPRSIQWMVSLISLIVSLIVASYAAALIGKFFLLRKKYSRLIQLKKRL